MVITLKMLVIVAIIAISLLLTAGGALYKTGACKAKSTKNKLRKIAKSAQIDVSLCKENEKSILKIKKELEEFTQRVASNLRTVEWILAQQVEIKDNIKKTESKLQKIREVRKRKSPSITYVSQSKETLI